MMTLEEVWENLRQNPETKATMEEVDKSYKLFKKIKNLIVADLEAKLKEGEKKAKAYAKEIIFLDKKLENLNKEFELAQEHNEKTVEYWQNEYSQLKQQCQECKHLNKKIDLNIKNKLMNEVQQLKQKLEDKEKAIEGLQEINQSLGQTCNNDAKEIERLREKENLLNLIVDGYYTPTNIVKKQIREQNQKAIAELEKVKADAEKLFNLDECNLALASVLSKIDQQIAELKGER